MVSESDPESRFGIGVGSRNQKEWYFVHFQSQSHSWDCSETGVGVCCMSRDFLYFKVGLGVAVEHVQRSESDIGDGVD